MLDSLIEIETHVTVRRPGHDTVQKFFRTWAEVNYFLRTLSKTPYPYGSVAKIMDWSGTTRFLLTGGGKDPVVMTKLSDRVIGLPSGPEKSPPPERWSTIPIFPPGVWHDVPPDQ